MIKFATEDLRNVRPPTVAHTEPEPQVAHTGPELQVAQAQPKVVPQPELLLQSKPQQTWLTPSHLELLKHRRREQGPNIPISFRGLSWQIGEYRHMESKEKWIVKVIAELVCVS